MKVRKENELRVQKKGRRETRGKQTRGLHKWLWEREKHEPGSETAEEAAEGGAGPLAPLASNSWVALSMLWKDGWLAGGGGFSGILCPSLTCRRSTVRGPVSTTFSASLAFRGGSCHVSDCPLDFEKPSVPITSLEVFGNAR
ncbi:hypothetical protein ACRRTK_017433 [Alexandromys fortis]